MNNMTTQLLTVTLEDLHDLLCRVSMVAIAEYEATRFPQVDKIKQSEVRRYLATQGIAFKNLGLWEEAGLVHSQKGESRNSAVWYSRAELEKAISVNLMQDMAIKSTIINNRNRK